MGASRIGSTRGKRSTRSRVLRAAALAFVALASMAQAGCKGCRAQEDSSEARDAAAPEQTTLTDEQAKKPLARIGDKTLTLGEYAAALEHMDQFDRLRYQSAERRKELLDEMITVELLAREAREKGYDKDALAQQELRGILRDAMLAEARKNVPAPEDIPDSDARAYFESRKADYKDPERRRVAVIVLRDEATAKEVLAAAQKTTVAAQFGELVRAKSIDPQARAGVPADLAGDLGIVSPPGDPRGENTRVPEEVRAAVFAVPEAPGIHDKVVAAGGKFYVVRLTQKLPAHERTFEEAARSIRVKLAQDKLRAREDELIAELRKSVKVEIDEAALASLKVDVPDAAAAQGLPPPPATPHTHP